MTLDEALLVLRSYRQGRAHLDEAVLTLANLGVPQTRIAREAGLSREGVRKILARHSATKNGEPHMTVVATIAGLTTKHADYLDETVRPHGGRVSHEGGGTRLDGRAYDVLRGLSDDSDGHIDDTEIWIGGTGYPVAIDAQAAIDALVTEGHPRDDVQAAFDSMVDAGFQLDQPDEGYVLTPGEVDVLREQLATTTTDQNGDQP
jgi:hypothetical protein